MTGYDVDDMAHEIDEQGRLVLVPPYGEPLVLAGPAGSLALFACDLQRITDVPYPELQQAQARRALRWCPVCRDDRAGSRRLTDTGATCSACDSLLVRPPHPEETAA